MQLLALGLNHTTAPLSIREAVAFSPEEIPGALSALRSTYARPEEGGIREALILSTCNRTEFFLAAENGDAALHSLCSFVARQKGIDLKEFLPHTYEYRQSDVARHTFRVASGLDSMVLGETQIVGQMKKAWRIARESKSLGLMLGHLFDGTFAAAKEVRTATAIGSHSVSLAAAGVGLANQLFGSLANQNVLFVGAGEMIELCAAHFCAQHPKKVTVANRTLEKGAALARRFGAEAVELRTLPEIVSQYDRELYRVFSPDYRAWHDAARCRGPASSPDSHPSVRGARDVERGSAVSTSTRLMTLAKWWHPARKTAAWR